ncbi:MAG: PAS domain S-box protein [Chloroflexota bacterium]
MKSDKKAKEQPIDELALLKQRVAELEATAAKYTTLVESGNDGIVIIQGGNLVFTNVKMKEMTGFSPDEGIGKPFIDFITPDYRTFVADIYRKRQAGKAVPNHYEAEMFGKNGTMIPIEVNASVIEHEGKPAVMAIIRDITERKQTEQAIHESEEKYRTLVESATDSIFVIDKDIRVLSVNTSGARFLRKNPEEIIGKSIANLFPKEVSRQFLENLRGVYKTGVPQSRESCFIINGRNLCLDTHLSPIKNSANEVVAVLGVARDTTERNQVEEELRESQRRYSALVEQSDDSILLIQGGLIKYANSATARMVGFLPAEIIGKPFVDFIAPEDREMVADRHKRRMTGEDVPSTYETKVIRKDGKTIPVETSAVRIEYDGKPAVVAIRRDISARKEAEAALLRERALANQYLQTAGVIMIALDKSGKVNLSNQKAIEVLGYTEKAIIGKNWFDTFIPDKDRKQVRGVFDKLMTGEVKPVDYFENPVLTKNGEERLIAWHNTLLMDDSRITGTLSSGEDITESKQTEKALQESEERYRTLVELGSEIGEAIVILQDTERGEGIQIFASEAWLRITGYSQKELLGKSFFDLVNSEDRESSRERHRAKMRGEALPGLFEMSVTRKDGTQVPIELTSTRTIYLGQPANVVYIRDITRRKQREEELRQTTARLVTSQRVAKLGSWGRDLSTGAATWSAEMFHLTGFEPSAPTPSFEAFLSFVHPEDRRLMQKHQANVIKTGKPGTFEFRTNPARGPMRNIISNIEPFRGPRGSIIKLSGTLQDITELKTVEEKLKTAEQNFRNSLDDSPLGIRIATLDGELIYANNALFDITGYGSIEELKAVPLVKLYTPESYERFLARRAKRILGEPLPLYYEVDVVRKDGEIRQLLLSAKEVIWDGKKRVQVAYQDITERKRLDKELRASEAKYRFLSDNMTDVAFMTDLNMRTIYVTPSIEKVLGFTPEERIKQLPHEQLTPESLKQASSLLYSELKKEMETGIPNTGPYVLELECYHKDHSVRILETVLGPVRDDMGKPTGIYGVGRDITERKQAEIKLKASEERFRNLVENAPTGIVIVDSEGRLIEANEAMWRMHGYDSKEEYMKSSIADRYYDPKDREHWMALIRETDKISGFEMRNKRKDGSLFWASAASMRQTGKSGETQYIVVAQDITQQKRALEELRESEERYRALIRLGSEVGEAVVMLWETDGEEAVHAFASEAWSKITGYSQEELLKMSFSRLVHPKDQPAARDRYYKRLSGEVISESFEETIVRKDGTEVMVEVTGARTNYKGKPAQVLYIRDVTQRKKMEDQLMTQDRLASIGQLVSGVAHELNNPLTGVIGFSDLVLQRELPDDIKDDINVVNREAKRAAAIVRNLLTFARKHPEEKRLVDINDGIKQVLELRAYEQKLNNIKVDTRLAAELPKILGNSTQLQQVFINIIGNAEFFMAEVHQKGILTITTERVGNFLRATFTDDGPGILKESLKLVFNPFFTTKEVGKGTGLGLSICHGIVTEHGGKIWAESELGKGATFAVELPIPSGKV